MRQTLSIAIIAFNEETNLPRTLEAVRWADEIVVVDSGSKDRTVEIAKSFNARVFYEPFRGHGEQKNIALDHCTSDCFACDHDRNGNAHERDGRVAKIVGADCACIARRDVSCAFAIRDRDRVL